MFPAIDIGKVRVQKLIDLLLDQPWHQDCVIIPDYMPPFPREDDRPSVVVRCDNHPKYPAYLRYSKGPKQGFFWDVYGDDMQTIELAILALSKAPAPISVAPITFTIPLSDSNEG